MLMTVHVQDNYGQKDPICEKRVKDIFNESPVSLPERFEAYEKGSYEKITKLIRQVNEEDGMRRDVFVSFLDKVYKRSK